MKTRKWMNIILIALLLVSAVNAGEQNRDNTGENECHIKKLAGGFKFAEGPAVDKNGNIFFTDILASRIYKWSVAGELSIFIENSQMSNGLYFDKNGDLLACSGGSGKLFSIDPKGNMSVLADSYNGNRFNSPNDLWIDPNEGIYFTDPRYWLFGPSDNLPQAGEYVYYISPNREKITPVITDLVRPNGIIGTRDGKILYVADQGGKKTYSYKITPDGTLTEKKLFADQTCDGMTLDMYGNVYLTIIGVNIYSPGGKLMKSINVPEGPTNVCFGGKDRKTLFITTQHTLYSIELDDIIKPREQ